jgi:hypothetical protein
MNYESDIRLDETALDVEWHGQASLMMKYGRHAADCRMNLDLAKERLDFVRAEIDKEIRQNPKQYQIEKITEATIQNIIITQTKYMEAEEKVIYAKYELDIASAAVRAIDARKDALENLVRLHGQQYFAGPRIPRDLHLEVERREKQQQANITVGSMRRKHIVT